MQQQSLSLSLDTSNKQSFTCDNGSRSYPLRALLLGRSLFFSTALLARFHLVLLPLATASLFLNLPCVFLKYVPVIRHARVHGILTTQ